MSEPKEERRSAGSKGCGCQAAVAFIILVGLPVLFVSSFGMAPCQDGPCNPDGARDFRTVAVVLLALAVLLGLGVWRIVEWGARRQPAGGNRVRRLLEIGGAALLLLAGAGLLAVIML